MTSNKILRARGTKEEYKAKRAAMEAAVKAKREGKPVDPEYEKLQPNTRGARWPKASPQLMDLVSDFLKSHGFPRAAHILRTETQAREQLGGLTFPVSWKEAAKRLPSLTEIFEEWEVDRKLDNEYMPNRKDKKGKSGQTEDRNKTSKSTSSNSGSDSGSGSDSDGSDSVDSADSLASISVSSKSDKSSLSNKAASSSSGSSSSEESSDASSNGSVRKAQVKTPSTSAKSQSNPGSSDDSESDSVSSASSGSVVKGTKRAAPQSSSSSSESSSSSSSDSESDVSNDEPPAKRAKTVIKKSSKSSSSDSSESDTSSDSDLDSEDEEPKRLKNLEVPPAKPMPSTRQDSTGSSTLAATSPNLAAQVTSNGKRKIDEVNGTSIEKSNQPFSRIDPSLQVDPRFSSNKYISYEWGDRAHQDLIKTKGRGFTKEKNKKKRGAYRGGRLDTDGGKSIKFDD